MSYALINNMTVKPGKRDEVVQILLESGKAFDDNEACLLYLVGTAVDDPNVIWIQDVWTDETSHQTAMETPEMAPYIKQSMPLLEGMPEQFEVNLVGGKSPLSIS